MISSKNFELKILQPHVCNSCGSMPTMVELIDDNPPDKNIYGADIPRISLKLYHLACDSCQYRTQSDVSYLSIIICWNLINPKVMG
jgi:hypothetical protein